MLGLLASMQEIQFPQLPEVSTSTVDAASWKGDLLLIGVFEDDIQVESGKCCHAAPWYGITSSEVTWITSKTWRQQAAG